MTGVQTCALPIYGERVGVTVLHVVVFRRDRRGDTTVRFLFNRGPHLRETLVQRCLHRLVVILLHRKFSSTRLLANQDQSAHGRFVEASARDSGGTGFRFDNSIFVFHASYSAPLY